MNCINIYQIFVVGGPVVKHHMLYRQFYDCVNPNPAGLARASCGRKHKLLKKAA
jgi:hypothetical protein